MAHICKELISRIGGKVETPVQKIALCDDTEDECAAIAAMLQEYAGERSGVRTSVFTSARELLRAQRRSCWRYRRRWF